jgi:hypothetical protein
MRRRGLRGGSTRWPGAARMPWAAMLVAALALSACTTDAGRTTAPASVSGVAAVDQTAKPGTASSSSPGATAEAAAAPTQSPSPSPAPTSTAADTPTTSPAATPTPSPRPTARPTARATPKPSTGAVPRPTPKPVATTARRWVPRKGTTWQWQLSGRIDLTVKAAVFDLDVDDTSAKTVKALHAKGRRVVCYVDVGTWESYRPDASKFPKKLLGKRVDGWPDERWLDIRRIDLLAPLLRARMDTCRRKGFDALEPDWLNHYEEDTGFPITRADSIRFDKWVAREAHRRGLSVAQKNAPGLTSALRRSFDFAITEDCALYDECGSYKAYLSAGHAVLDAEYEQSTAQFCPETKRLGVTAIAKRLSLGAWRRTCP